MLRSRFEHETSSTAALRREGHSRLQAASRSGRLRHTSELREALIGVCKRIVSGAVQPREGAARIWVLLAEADYPTDVEDFRAFAGAVSEMQDHPEHAAAYADDMREMAKAKLAQERS